MMATFVNTKKTEESQDSLIAPELLDDMMNLWSVLELEETNEVPIRQIQKLMRALDFDLSKEELEVCRKQMDPESRGFLRFDAWRKLIEQKMKPVDTYEEVFEELRKLDKDGDNLIPVPEFKQYMMHMGRKLKQPEVDELLKVADRGEGKVNIEDFCQIICPTIRPPVKRAN